MRGYVTQRTPGSWTIQVSGGFNEAGIRDILMQFKEGDPPRYALVAVVMPEADAVDVRRLLADVAAAVPTALGVGDRFDVGTSDEVALSLIETSYAADVTQVTWRGANPEGAH